MPLSWAAAHEECECCAFAMQGYAGMRTVLSRLALV